MAKIYDLSEYRKSKKIKILREREHIIKALQRDIKILEMQLEKLMQHKED
mgnify:CR=1 FL=1